MAQRHSIVTVAGRNKEAAKTAANQPMVFKQIALGSGVRHPAGGETALETEVHRGAISSSGVEGGQPNAVYFDLLVPATVDTFHAQEIGLFDEDGVLYALSRFPEPIPKFGPDSSSSSEVTFRIIVVFSDTENVVVKTSPISGVTGNRRIDTDEASGLLGGGDISENRTHSIRQASTGKRGTVQLATRDEAVAGEDTDKAVTSHALAAVVGGNAKATSFISMLVLSQYPSNSAGEALAPGGWRTRNLNNVAHNKIDGASLANRQILLPAGKYFARFFGTMHSADQVFQERLFNVTANAMLALGMLADSGATSNSVTGRSAYFELAETSAIEQQIFFKFPSGTAYDVLNVDFSAAGPLKLASYVEIIKVF